MKKNMLRVLMIAFMLIACQNNLRAMERLKQCYRDFVSWFRQDSYSGLKKISAEEHQKLLQEGEKRAEEKRQEFERDRMKIDKKLEEQRQQGQEKSDFLERFLQVIEENEEEDSPY